MHDARPESKKKSGDLRKRAEELLLCKASHLETISELPPEDVQKLVHELRVHQIELEMQNDECVGFNWRLKNPGRDISICTTTPRLRISL